MPTGTQGLLRVLVRHRWGLNIWDLGMCAQVPSHSGLPADGNPDTIRMPEVVMWNLPIVHNKSSERWKNVRPSRVVRLHPHWVSPCAMHQGSRCVCNRPPEGADGNADVCHTG